MSPAKRFLTHRGELAWILGLCVPGVVYYLLYFDRGMYLLDDGLLVDPAMRVLGGEIPFRDFRHVYSPGRFYLVAALFGLAEPDLLTVRYLWILLNLSAAVLVYVATRFVAARPSAIVNMLLVILSPGPWHKSFLILCSTAILVLALTFLRAPSRVSAGLLGVGIGGAFVFRQDVAVYGLAACLTCYAWCRFANETSFGTSRLGWVLAGASMILIPFFGYFFSVGALSPLIEDLLLTGYRGTSANSLPFPSLISPWPSTLRASLERTVFYLPFVVYVSLTYRLLRYRAHRLHASLCFLLCFGVLGLLQLKNRTDLAHLWQVLPIVLVALAAISTRPPPSESRPGTARYLAAASAWSALVIVAFANPSTGSIALKFSNTHLLDLERAEVYVASEALADSLLATVRFLEARAPASDFWAVPDIPILYFLAGRTSPSKYEMFRKGVNSSEAAQRTVIGEIEQRRLPFLVLNTREINDGLEERNFAVHSPLLYDYIRKTYLPQESFGQFQVSRWAQNDVN